MNDVVGTIDMELLTEQIKSVNEKLPNDGAVSFLRWIRAAIKEHGIVLILDADAEEFPPFDRVIASMQELLDTKEKQNA